MSSKCGVCSNKVKPNVLTVSRMFRLVWGHALSWLKNTCPSPFSRTELLNKQPQRSCNLTITVGGGIVQRLSLSTMRITWTPRWLFPAVFPDVLGYFGSGIDVCFNSMELCFVSGASWKNPWSGGKRSHQNRHRVVQEVICGFRSVLPYIVVWVHEAPCEWVHEARCTLLCHLQIVMPKSVMFSLSASCWMLCAFSPWPNPIELLHLLLYDVAGPNALMPLAAV